MASNNEIEKLTVTLELDYQTYLRDVQKAVDETLRKMKETEESPKKQKTHWEQLATFLSGKFMQVVTGIGVAIVAAFSVQAVTAFFSAIAKGMVDTNKQFERFETQFTTLLGSQEAAQKRISELSKFAIATPFELDKVTEASRLLQTFAGSDFAAGDKLRQIGDSAAATGAELENVSFWTGRLIADLKNGRPFGEAASRLGELGIMGGDVRVKMEEMQKAGKDSSEVIAFYFESLEKRFSGSMDRMSKTLEGTISNLNDFKDMLLREGGEGFFEGIKGDAQEFYSIISDPEAQEALVDLAKAFGDIFDSLREAVTGPLLEQLKDIDPKRVESLAQSIQDIGDAIDSISGENVTSLEGLINTLDGMAQTTASLLQILNILKEASFAVSGLTAISGGMDAITESGVDMTNAILGALNPIYGMADAFGTLNQKVKELTGSSISEWLGNVDKEIKNTSSSLDVMGLSGTTERGGTKTTEAPQEDFSKAREKFEDLSQSFFDAQQEIGEKREEAEKEHGEKVAEIVENYGERVAELEEEIADRREEIVKDTADRLADLEEEGAERREEIAENTAKALTRLAEETASSREEAQEGAREALAKLESETQSAVEEVQEEARDKERRATEDHQREMRRLQRNYLLDLEDAVKNRDARAIRDLRQTHQQKMREREEDFRTQQTRDRSDTRKRIEDAREAEEKRKREIEEALEKQLEEIEENEAKKRAEIEASQQEQLEKLSESEAEKRAEIEASQAEQLAKLEELEAEKRAKIDESLAEQLAAEQESYAERQALLDQALAKKLEAVAQQLAQEKEITEAGAQAILETLNQYYGAGGEIDQLMDAYRERQAAQMAATANFDANLPGGGDFVPAGSGGGSGLPAFQEGGIVPGPRGKKRLVIAHAGELILPLEESARFMEQQGQMMASNLDNSPKVVEIKLSGSAPPGVRGAEVEAMAGVIVQALNEAGIRARKK